MSGGVVSAGARGGRSAFFAFLAAVNGGGVVNHAADGRTGWAVFCLFVAACMVALSGLAATTEGPR